MSSPNSSSAAATPTGFPPVGTPAPAPVDPIPKAVVLSLFAAPRLLYWALRLERAFMA